jgi:polar amino acid transport system substrate-binding protein
MGCDFPRDANGALARVQREGVLRAGYCERPPWVEITKDDPEGIEPQLIEKFGSSLGARVEWVGGSESSLIEALRAGQIDILIGGFARDTNWASRAAVSHVYTEAKVVVTFPTANSVRALSDLEDAVIAYRPSRPDFAALITSHEARPEARNDWRGQLAVAYEFELREEVHRSRPMKIEKHVMLATSGESGLLYALDRFLGQPVQLAGATKS